MLSVGTAMAQTMPADENSDSQPVMTIDHNTLLVPERWCLKSQMTIPVIASLFEPRPATVMPDSMVNYIHHDFLFVDHSVLATRLAELDSDRLITFWQGRTLGVFFGITESGHIGFNIGQSTDSK